MNPGLFGGFPVWAVFAATILAFAVAMKLGHLSGTRARARTGEATTPDLGATVGGLLGLLGLLLAFTFGMAGERFDRRKALVVEEANAIGTAWLRIDLIPPPQQARAREAFRAYTRARLDAAQPSTRDQALVDSERLHAEMWNIAAAASAASPTPTVALFVAAVNEVIDMHGRRLAAALRNPIPPTIFATLYAVAVLVLGITGYARGLSGDRSLLATLVLALVLAVVLALILDLDRPFEGLLTVSQQAIQDLLTGMQAVR